MAQVVVRGLETDWTDGRPAGYGFLHSGALKIPNFPKRNIGYSSFRCEYAYGIGIYLT